MTSLFLEFYIRNVKMCLCFTKMYLYLLCSMISQFFSYNNIRNMVRFQILKQPVKISSLGFSNKSELMNISIHST